MTETFQTVSCETKPGGTETASRTPRLRSASQAFRSDASERTSLLTSEAWRENQPRKDTLRNETKHLTKTN